MNNLHKINLLLAAMSALLLAACVEDAELDPQVKLDTDVSVQVQQDKVILTSSLSATPEFAEAEECGFVVRRSVSGGLAVTDTIHGDAQDAQFQGVLTEDIWPDIDIEAFAYMTFHGQHYRSRSARFRGKGGAETVVESIEIIPDNNDVYGKIIVKGNNFSRLKAGPGIKLGKELKGKVETRVVSSTPTQIVMEYSCCNVGDFPMAFTYRGLTFDKGNVLSVHSPKMAPITETIYAGVPFSLNIDYVSGINALECTMDDQFVLSTSNKYYTDDVWRVAFTGELDRKHKIEVHFMSRNHEDIWFEPMEIEMKSHWKEIGTAGWSVMPQCYVGGYGWKLTGGWNEFHSYLYRMDPRTGEEIRYDAPVGNYTDEVWHMLGYAADYNVFGDPDGDKVYCAFFIAVEEDDIWESHGHVRVYTFDIEDCTWQQVCQIPAGSANANGYQIFAKVDERIYYIDYLRGNYGWYDLVTGEMSELRNNQLLAQYYNEYVGHSGTKFFFDFFDGGPSDLNVFDYDPVADTSTFSYNAGIRNSSRLKFNSYGSSSLYYNRTRVEGDFIFTPYSMRSIRTSDLSEHAYYGYPDGVNGGCAMVLIDGDFYAIEGTGGRIWKYED